MMTMLAMVGRARGDGDNDGGGGAILTPRTHVRTLREPWLIACLALADGQRALRTRSARGAPGMGVRLGSGLVGALRGPLVLGLWT